MSERYGRAVHDNRARWVKAVGDRWAILSKEPWFGGEPTGDFVSGEWSIVPTKPLSERRLGS